MAHRVSYEEVVAHLSCAHEYADYTSALCPFHDDHSPSLMVYKDGWVRCLACGFGGSYVDLMRKLEGWRAPVSAGAPPTVHTLPTDLEDLHELCEDAHSMLLRYPHPLGDYLIRRKVWNRVVPQRLGYADGWYSIPCYGKQGNFEGAVMRASPQVQESTGARFNIPKGQPPLFYVPDWELTRSNAYFCVVFGMFDALALCELGIPSGTSTSGKDSTNAEQLEWCRKPIIIIPDKGEEDTGRHLLSKLGWRGTLLVLDYPSNCKDPADCLEHGNGEWLCKQIEDVV